MPAVKPTTRYTEQELLRLLEDAQTFDLASCDLSIPNDLLTNDWRSNRSKNAKKCANYREKKAGIEELKIQFHMFCKTRAEELCPLPDNVPQNADESLKKLRQKVYCKVSRNRNVVYNVLKLEFAKNSAIRESNINNNSLARPGQGRPPPLSPPRQGGGDNAYWHHPGRNNNRHSSSSGLSLKVNPLERELDLNERDSGSRGLDGRKHERQTLEDVTRLLSPNRQGILAEPGTREAPISLDESPPANQNHFHDDDDDDDSDDDSFLRSMEPSFEFRRERASTRRNQRVDDNLCNSRRRLEKPSDGENEGRKPSVSGSFIAHGLAFGGGGGRSRRDPPGRSPLAYPPRGGRQIARDPPVASTNTIVHSTSTADRLASLRASLQELGPPPPGISHSSAGGLCTSTAAATTTTASSGPPPLGSPPSLSDREESKRMLQMPSSKIPSSSASNDDLDQDNDEL